VSGPAPRISSFAPHCDECPLRLTGVEDPDPKVLWRACRCRYHPQCSQCGWPIMDDASCPDHRGLCAACAREDLTRGRPPEDRHELPALLGALSLAPDMPVTFHLLLGTELDDDWGEYRVEWALIPDVTWAHPATDHVVAHPWRVRLPGWDAPQIILRWRQWRVGTPEQVQTLLCAVQGDRLHALYVLAVSTGMRQGELLALRWRDVDLAGSALAVRATLQRTKEEGYVLRTPKTKQSQRRITLGAVASAALRTHRARQAEERLAVGSEWDASLDLVFPNTLGRPMDATNLLHYHFYPLLKRAGLPRTRFHDLRHTAATLLLGRGVNPKIVSEMLGHASISITLDVYSHVLPDMQAHAAREMDAVLNG
jgi:integrase